LLPMMNPTARYATLILSLFVAGLLTALASSSPAIAQEEEESRYLVELVIFRHLDSSKTTPETQRPGAQVMRAPSDGIAYRAATGGGRKLGGTARQIRNLSAYQLISHLAWVQTADDVEEAQHADLNRIGLDPAIVYGSAKLFSRRYLHLDLQLRLQATEAVIKSSRRIRLNQYHYFDHPDFGVITLVTRAN